MSAKIHDPIEYLKLRYMGDCKCGNCQLVPPEQLKAWSAERDVMVKALEAAEKMNEALVRQDDYLGFLKLVDRANELRREALAKAATS